MSSMMGPQELPKRIIKETENLMKVRQRAEGSSEEEAEADR